MLTARIPLLILAVGLLLNFVSAASSEARQVKTIDNIHGSFHCGRKLFFATSIKKLFGFALRRPDRFINADGKLNFKDAGPLFIWPLSTRSGQQLAGGDQTNYYLVKGGPTNEFLGMVFQLQRDIYVRCIEGSAAGEIDAVTSSSGGFQCGAHFVSTQIVIDFAKEVRGKLSGLGYGLLGKYPISYTGNVALESSRPYYVWPMTKEANFHPGGEYHIVHDRNFKIVGVFYHKGRKECEKVAKAQIRPEISGPPFRPGPDEYDAFHLGLFWIKTSKVLQDTREAFAVFQKRSWNPNHEYPKVYTGKLFSGKHGHLYLWPVRIKHATGNFKPHSKEPFLVVITKQLLILGVVFETKTGELIRAQRSGQKIEFF